MAFKPVVVVSVRSGVADDEINTGATLLIIDWDNLKEAPPDEIEEMIKRVKAEVRDQEKAKHSILKDHEDCLKPAKEIAAEQGS